MANCMSWGVTTRDENADGVVYRLLPESLRGDFDFDRDLDVDDIEQLTQAVLSDEPQLAFDVNLDGRVDRADRVFWVHRLKRTYFGDVDLDGIFDSSDLITALVAGEYEDNLLANSTWTEGDWDGNREFESTDLVVAFRDGGYELGPRHAETVPEPASCLILMFGVLVLGVSARRRHLAA